MTGAIKFQAKVRFRCGRKGRKQVVSGDTAGDSVETGRVPRVSRLMALAIRFDGLIRDSIVTDQAELASLGRVTRARLTQIMNLLQLAPEIQESLLFLPRVEAGRNPIHERQLRPIAAMADWRKQRRMWRALGGGDC